MEYDFETVRSIRDMGSLQYSMMPEALKERGIVSFQGAEMTFATAPSVIRELRDLVDNGIYGFTLADEAYLDRITWWMKEVREWHIGPETIVPMHGTIYSVASMIRTVTHEGDGIIVQPPVYPRYEQAVRRLSRRIVYNPLICENGRYSMDLNDLENRMKDPDNRLLVICNPHNPVGRVWTEEELKGVAFLSHKYAKHVISDEIFAEIAFDGRRTVPYISVPGAEEYGAVITSLGKTFNFTGVNHANVIITDPELRDRYIERKYADDYGSVGPFEYASIIGAYCEEGKRWMEAMRDHLQKIRDRLAAGLEDIFPGICISPAEGSSVMWMDFSRILGADPAEVLMNKALVQTESGTDFSPGGEGRLRWCFSTSEEQIDDALSRLHAVFKEGKDVP